MDPLSIISGVAGIASAGTALVSSLYTLVKTVRNAPREMRDVAKEMTSLTSALEYLVEIISDGHSIATRQYLSGIKSVLGSIESTQNEIMDMIVDRSILSRWKWRRAKSLLEDVRAHQNMVSMQVAILNLGMLKKNFGRYVYSTRFVVVMWLTESIRVVRRKQPRGDLQDKPKVWCKRVVPT